MPQPTQPAMPLTAVSARMQRRHAAGRTLAALILREMSTRFGRTPGGFVWALAQPLATILVLAFAFSLIAKNPALGTSFILFKATGLLPFQLFKATSTLVGRSLSYSAALLTYPGVVWLDALLARFLLNILVNAVVTVLILSGIVVFEDVTLILDWGAVLLAMSLAAFLALGVGALNCYLFERFEIWAQIWGIATAPLMLISGVLILYENTPAEAQGVLWFNPLIHVSGLMRAGFYSTYHPDYISVAYVAVCALVPMVLGLLLLRRHHRMLLNR